MPTSSENGFWVLRSPSSPSGEAGAGLESRRRRMKILFAHNRYQNLGGEDLAASVEMELVERHGHTVELIEVDNAQIVGFAGKIKAALGTVYSPTSKKGLA